MSEKRNDKTILWIILFGISLATIFIVLMVFLGGTLWNQFQGYNPVNSQQTDTPIENVQTNDNLSNTPEPQDSLEPTPTLSLFTTQPPSLTPTENFYFPSDEILYSDNFDDVSSGWGVWEGEFGFAQYKNDKFHMRASNSYGVWAKPATAYSMVAIEVDAELFEGTANNGFGIICNFQDENNYSFGVISSDGYYAFEEYVDGVFAYIDSDAMTYSDDIPTDGNSARIILECWDYKMVLYVNGTYIGETTSVNELSGGVGLWAETLETEYSEIAFDNFTISNLIPPNPEN